MKRKVLIVILAVAAMMAADSLAAEPKRSHLEIMG